MKDRPSGLRGQALALAMALPLALPIAAPQAVASEEAATPAPVALERVVIKGQALRGANAPFSTTSFDTDEVREQRVNQPQQLFRLVPGMTVRNFQLGAVADAFVLRGFNSGGHGGDVGVVIDGIPLNEAMSHADGYADLNVVIPLEIGAMTIYRGPVSALYGNYNRGGLIAFETRKGGAYRNADVSLGSYSTLDAQAALGTAMAGGALNLAAQVFRTDGYRPQSDTSRGTLAGRWGLDLTPALTLSVAGRVHRGEGDSAAYLTRTQFEADPRGIDPRVQNDGADKDFATLRTDLAWQLAPQMRLLGFVYGTQQSFTRWFSRPLNATTWAQREETYDRDVLGAGLNLNGQARVAAGALNWVAGIETFREDTAYQFYDNLALRQRTTGAIYDRDVSLDSVSLFGEVEAPLHRLFKPWLAVRHDRFSGDCARRGPETGADGCGPLNKTARTSPKLGVRSDVLPAVRLRASWAEGFALPSNFIKYSAGATGLDPNVFRQTELGGTASLDDVRVDLAVYRITSTSEFRTVAPGVFENFGATRRSGWEASVDWMPLPELKLALAYGSADSEITQNANAALVGKKVTGVPESTATLSAQFAPAAGLGGGATLRRVGAYAVNADNSLVDGSYRTLDLAATWAGRSGGLRYRASAGIDNATDRTYATSITIIGGQQMVAPAAPRTYRVGVQIDF
jgi:iron complex outermembrane receptor protein